MTVPYAYLLAHGSVGVLDELVPVAFVLLVGLSFANVLQLLRRSEGSERPIVRFFDDYTETVDDERQDG